MNPLHTLHTLAETESIFNTCLALGMNAHAAYTAVFDYEVPSNMDEMEAGEMASESACS